MKKIFILGSLLFLYSCEEKPFTGYIVGKEYIEGHMCHDEGYEHTLQATVVHVPHVHVHHHKWQNSEFILHVANYKELRHIHVDSLTFANHKMLEEITLK